MIQESLGELARIQSQEVSKAKGGFVLGILLFFISTYCIKRGRVWIPRTTGFTYRNQEPKIFWSQILILYFGSLLLIGSTISKLYNFYIH